MIDFRYHLVSLISVFLALAVGIVLGAGIVQGPIGSSLQSQVDALRTDRDTLRTELERGAHAHGADGGIRGRDRVRPHRRLPDGPVGDGRHRLAGADNDAADAASARAEEAGGSIASDVSLGEDAFAAPDAELHLRARRGRLVAGRRLRGRARGAREGTRRPGAGRGGGRVGAAHGRAGGRQAEDPPTPGSPRRRTSSGSCPMPTGSRAGSGLRPTPPSGDRPVRAAGCLGKSHRPRHASRHSHRRGRGTRRLRLAIHADFASALAGETVVVVAGPSASATGGLLATS